MTMNYRAGKNGEFPLFDRNYKGYPGFKRHWSRFQALHYANIPQRELIHLFKNNCLDRKVEDKVRKMESIAAC
jgi:hypothetical protein